MKIIVLGAGVVGVTTAYYLAERGHEVEVIDRQPGPGLETSFANGGQVSASHAEPWANPRTPLKILKWLGRRDAPLKFRLQADPALWDWGLRFLWNCWPWRTRVNIERTLRVALYSRHCLAELRQATALQYDQQRKGILHFYRDAGEFRHACRQAALMTDLGCHREPLDVAGALRIEPALAPAKDQLIGAIYSPDDESGDAHLFTRGLAGVCEQMGVRFRYGTTVRRLLAEGDRLDGDMGGVDTDAGLLSADAYVLCLGSYSPLLLGRIGLEVPIYPAKGYSVTLPLTAPERAPTVSLTDDENKTVYSRLGNRLRIAGTAETAGYDTSVDAGRARSLLIRALTLFPGVGDPATTELWAGLRPKTPDSVPVLGRTPFPSLYLNTGHGTLGWTMSCGSGRAIADLISGRRPEIDLQGLGIDRFR